MDIAVNILVVATTVVVTGVLVFYKPLARSKTWLATVTPLASIMGSGFLVCAPLLAATVGTWAAPAMAGLLALAYAVGSAVRFNIRHAEPLLAGDQKERPIDAAGAREHRLWGGHSWRVRLAQRATSTRLLKWLETASQFVLAIAYLISVTYYLKLLAAFVLRGITGSEPASGLSATLSTGVLAAIAAVGAIWGLRMLEKLERYAVGLNLGMIAALIVGLAAYNLRALVGGEWSLPTLATERDPLTVVRILLGLLIIVQGFETSLFLGSEHPAEERIRTMRWAQWIATAVYLVFLSLATVLLGKLDGGDKSGVTAVVAMSGFAATALPAMLVVAVAGSQFSAAVADDSGSGGLISQLLNGRLAMPIIYLAIGGAAVGLTWLTDVKQIISIASRAFATFYAVQCTIAAIAAARAPKVTHRPARALGYAALATACALAAVLGMSAEG